MIEYEIKKGLPVPDRRMKYPLRDMEPGDCFDVPGSAGRSAAAAARAYAARAGVKVVARKINEGGEIVYRIWRVG